jgi:hypothetical protein
MVLSTRDNSNPASRTAGSTELLAFARMTGHLGVQDFFSYSNSILFSWDNRIKVGPRKLERLDKFYCFPSPTGNPATHVLSYEILCDCLVSDHLPVTLRLEIQPETSQGSRYKLNNHYLMDTQVVDQLKTLWYQFSPTLGFFGKLQRLVKWYKVYCRNQAQARKSCRSYPSAATRSNSSMAPVRP